MNSVCIFHIILEVMIGMINKFIDLNIKRNLLNTYE
jgi:hypothetical protein